MPIRRMGIPRGGSISMGGLGPGAKTLWFEITKKMDPDLRSWPKQRALREQVASVSLAIARATARQLWLRCKVADQCADLATDLLPPPTC